MKISMVDAMHEHHSIFYQVFMNYTDSHKQNLYTSSSSKHEAK